MKRSIFFCLLFIIHYSSAQEREGNIVEYFGKEKVEDISEGEVIHLFDQGLILKNWEFPGETESVLSDPLFAKFLTDERSDIHLGKMEIRPQGPAVKWEKIEAGGNNEFEDNGLGNGYLYLEYFSDSN